MRGRSTAVRCSRPLDRNVNDFTAVISRDIGKVDISGHQAVAVGDSNLGDQSIADVRVAPAIPRVQRILDGRVYLTVAQLAPIQPWYVKNGSFSGQQLSDRRG